MYRTLYWALGVIKYLADIAYNEILKAIYLTAYFLGELNLIKC